MVTALAIVNIMNGAEQRNRKILVLFKKHNDDMELMIGNVRVLEIGTISFVDKELSSKIARTTFGTTFTLANNVPMETISKMMGHKSALNATLR